MRKTPEFVFLASCLVCTSNSLETNLVWSNGNFPLGFVVRMNRRCVSVRASNFERCVQRGPWLQKGHQPAPTSLSPPTGGPLFCLGYGKRQPYETKYFNSRSIGHEQQPQTSFRKITCPKSKHTHLKMSVLQRFLTSAPDCFSALRPGAESNQTQNAKK